MLCISRENDEYEFSVQPLEEQSDWKDEMRLRAAGAL
jgi:hypothetical protein